MKTMTCKQLGGACEKEFHANTFNEMAKMSQDHGKEMAQKSDKVHLAAMGRMMEMSTQDMSTWMREKEEEFKNLPEDREH